jgi:hypothetical protein
VSRGKGGGRWEGAHSEMGRLRRRGVYRLSEVNRESIQSLRDSSVREMLPSLETSAVKAILQSRFLATGLRNLDVFTGADVVYQSRATQSNYSGMQMRQAY